MKAFAAVAVLWIGFPGQVGEDLRLKDVERLATEALDAAVAAMPRAKGEGRYQYIIRDSVDGEATFEREGAYSFAFSGEKNWGKFVKSLERDYDATVYVSDAESLMVAYFSPDISPFGGNGIIQRLPRPGLLPPRLFVTPQAATEAWAFFRTRERGNDENRLVTLEKVDDQYVIQIEKNNGVKRFHIDPNKGFHFVRYESREPDGYTTRIVTKDWCTTAGGLWYVRVYHNQDFPIRARTNYTSSRITIDSIEPNINIPPEVFTVDALGLPIGAVMKDTRFVPNVTIHVRPPETDVAALEEIIGKLPGSAVSVSTGSSRLRLWLILVNVGTVIIIIGFLLRRRARRKRL